MASASAKPLGNSRAAPTKEAFALDPSAEGRTPRGAPQGREFPWAAGGWRGLHRHRSPWPNRYSSANYAGRIRRLATKPYWPVSWRTSVGSRNWVLNSRSAPLVHERVIGLERPNSQHSGGADVQAPSARGASVSRIGRWASLSNSRSSSRHRRACRFPAYRRPCRMPC